MRFALPDRRRPFGPVLLELDLSRGVVETPSAAPLRIVGARPAPHSPRATDRAPPGGARQARRGSRRACRAAADQPRPLERAARRRWAVSQIGKVAVAWTESFGELGVGNVGYHLATAFEEIWLQPSGDVGLTGVVARAVFVRDALDRLGVEPQLAQRHEYKTAADTFSAARCPTPGGRWRAGSPSRPPRRSWRTSRQLAVSTRPPSARSSTTRRSQRRRRSRQGWSIGLATATRSMPRCARRLGDVRLLYVERYGRRRERGRAVRRAVAGRSSPVVALVRASGPIHLGHSSSVPGAGQTSAPTRLVQRCGPRDAIRPSRPLSSGSTALAGRTSRAMRFVARFSRCAAPAVR